MSESSQAIDALLSELGDVEKRTVGYVEDMKSSLPKFVASLAELRKEIAEAKAEAALIIANAKATDAYVIATNKLENANAAAEQMAVMIRGYAKAIYEAEGDKKPAAGVGIRETTTLRYDPDVARKYCLEHLPGAIQVDFGFFEKHAKAIAKTAALEWVTIEKVPEVTIAGDLDKALKGD